MRVSAMLLGGVVVVGCTAVAIPPAPGPSVPAAGPTPAEVYGYADLATFSLDYRGQQVDFSGPDSRASLSSRVGVYDLVLSSQQTRTFQALMTAPPTAPTPPPPNIQFLQVFANPKGLGAQRTDATVLMRVTDERSVFATVISDTKGQLTLDQFAVSSPPPQAMSLTLAGSIAGSDSQGRPYTIRFAGPRPSASPSPSPAGN